MNVSSIRRAGSGATLIVMLLAILATATQASAQGNIVTRSTTLNALAEATLCTVSADGAETCSLVSLHVSPDKEYTTTIVCVGIVTGDRYEEGCADVAATFSMDNEELSWATLAPTTVQVRSVVCPPKGEPGECTETYRPVTVAASWSATGELTRVTETIGNPHGPCTVTDKIDGWIRDQAVTITLDGSSASTSGNLQLLDSRTIRRTNCG